MKRIESFGFVGLLAAMIFLAGAVDASAKVKVGEGLPKLTLEDLAGKAVSLNDLIKDQPSLVVYWSVTCDHCLKDLPLVLSGYKSNPNPGYRLVLIASETPEETATAKDFLEFAGLGQAVALFEPPKKEGQPEGPFLGDVLGLMYVPSFIVTCRQGTVTHLYEGSPELKQLKTSLEEAVSGKACADSKPGAAR